jgi:hypothetical protein
MPEIDLLITNGGYGAVNMAISHGIAVCLTFSRQAAITFSQRARANQGTIKRRCINRATTMRMRG